MKADKMEAQDISWRQLKKMSLNDPATFELSLANNSAPVISKEILRVVPGKRMVIDATWEGKAVVAKIFFQPRKAKKHLQQDLAGVEVLVASGVPTPKLLLQSPGSDKHIQILIFEKINQAKTLDMLWHEKTNSEEMVVLLRQVMIELATQHVLGIVQKDLHLKNFLISNKLIYTLDGGSIEQVEEILSKEKSLDHLALFFSQLGVGHEDLRRELFDVYTKSRGWLVKSIDHEVLSQLINKWLKIRWQRYQQKIFRNCSAFKKLTQTTSFAIYDRDYESADFLSLMKNPDSFFNDTENKILKSGRSSTVILIKINDKNVVVKRYNLKNPLHWLRRCLRESRGVASWRLAHRLQLMGIDTAKPIAFIENRIIGLRDKSYFFMEYIDGPNLGEYFSQLRPDESKITYMANQVLALLKNLLKLRMTHGDLKMTNILIHQDKPLLIDLDGMAEHKTFYGLKRAWQQEIKRFMKNWENSPSIKTLFERISK